MTAAIVLTQAITVTAPVNPPIVLSQTITVTAPAPSRLYFNNNGTITPEFLATLSGDTIELL